MNTTLSNHEVRTDHPPIELHDVREHEARELEARRVHLLDRIALHLGIALIKWGRRPLVLATRERRANRIEQQLLRLDRERAYERTLRLTTPLR